MKKIKAGGKGPEGSAAVEIKKSKVMVSFTDGEFSGETFTVPLKNCPENIRATKNAWVVLNSDEDAIWQYRPTSGVYTARFQEFAHREGEKPAPKTQVGKFGEYETMLAILEITEGKFKSATCPLFLSYKFDQDDEGNLAITGGGASTERLETFMDVIGLWNDDIEFEENALPRIQKLAKKKNRKFTIVMKDGFVQSLAPTVDDDDDDWYEDAETDEETEEPIEDSFDDPDDDDEDEDYTPPKKSGRKKTR